MVQQQCETQFVVLITGPLVAEAGTGVLSDLRYLTTSLTGWPEGKVFVVVNKVTGQKKLTWKKKEQLWMSE